MPISKEMGTVLADRIRSEFYRGTPPWETLEIVNAIYQQRLRPNVNAKRGVRESRPPKKTVKP